MKDMALTAEEAKEYMGPCSPSNGKDDSGPKYPWGLELSLNGGSLEKLGMSVMPKVGEEVMVQALATVTSVSMRQERDGDKHSNVSLQITKMDVGASKSDAERASVLYPNMG